MSVQGYGGIVAFATNILWAIMSLQDLFLSPVIDTSSADMTGEFYVPAVSVKYDRGVDFFVALKQEPGK